MKHFFLICHEPLGSALQKCVEFSMGKTIKEIINIDVSPEYNLLQIQERIDRKWH